MSPQPPSTSREPANVPPEGGRSGTKVEEARREPERSEGLSEPSRSPVTLSSDVAGDARRGQTATGTAWRGAVLFLPLIAVGIFLVALGVYARLGSTGKIALLTGALLVVLAVAWAVAALWTGPDRLAALGPLLILLAAAATAPAVTVLGNYVGPPTTPVNSGERAERAVVDHDSDRLCGLLSHEARGPLCARGTLCAADADPNCGSPQFSSGLDRVPVAPQVLGAWTNGLDPDAPDARLHYTRMVRDDGAWRLLDVPGLVDRCVDDAVHRGRDAFRCPVTAH